MTSRRGFTLLETIVALTLAAIVLTVATSALAAASDARTVVERDRASVEAESRLRGLLIDMLRHPPRADAVNEPLLHLARDGAGAVAVVFLSKGVTQPFGTGPVWRVTLTADSARGVSLHAEPLRPTADRAPTTLHVALPHLVSQHVAVMDGATATARAGWRLDWPVMGARPAAIRIEWRRANEATGSTPLVIALDPLARSERAMTGVNP